MSVPEPNPPSKNRPPSGLSLALTSLLQKAAVDPQKKLTLGHIVSETGESAFGVLMAFLCLPFLTPIPLPLVSIPFGIALFLLGCQLVIQRNHPWLPARLMNWPLPKKFGMSMIKFVARVLRPLERIIHPRFMAMQGVSGTILAGIALALDGLALALLPPIPLSNAIPAWMAMVKILGITERDGVALLAGTILTFTALAVGVGALVGGVSIFT